MERARRRIVITGSNRGIGLELCRQLAARGDEVVAVCRKRSNALDALGIRVEPEIDVGDDRCVKQLAERLAQLPIDILINNAGVFEQTTLDSLKFDSIRSQFEVNALGPLRVSRALLPNLGPGSKIALVTSLMGSIGDNTSGGYYGYRMSKAALNAAGVSLAHDLRGRKIAVALLHPGLVATEMTDGAGVPVAESVRGLISRIDALTLETSGTFWDAEGDVLPW